jgi:hypothetical protein
MILRRMPGEKQADYFDVAVRVVRAANPRDAIEEGANSGMIAPAITE